MIEAALFHSKRFPRISRSDTDSSNLVLGYCGAALLESVLMAVEVAMWQDYGGAAAGIDEEETRETENHGVRSKPGRGWKTTAPCCCCYETS